MGVVIQSRTHLSSHTTKKKTHVTGSPVRGLFACHGEKPLQIACSPPVYTGTSGKPESSNIGPNIPFEFRLV